MCPKCDKHTIARRNGVYSISATNAAATRDRTFFRAASHASRAHAESRRLLASLGPPVCGREIPPENAASAAAACLADAFSFSPQLGPVQL